MFAAPFQWPPWNIKGNFYSEHRGIRHDNLTIRTDRDLFSIGCSYKTVYPYTVTSRSPTRYWTSSTSAMDLTCFCGIAFRTVSALYEHATSQGHRYQCSCGTLLGTDTQLKIHQRTVDHGGFKRSAARLKALHGIPGRDQPQNVRNLFGSSLQHTTEASVAVSYNCNACDQKTFKDGEALAQHVRDKHPSCPTCRKTFYDKYRKKFRRSAREQLFAHQQGTGHCYCAEHRIAFVGDGEYEAHKLNVVHIGDCPSVHTEKASHFQQTLDELPAGIQKMHSNNESVLSSTPSGSQGFESLGTVATQTDGDHTAEGYDDGSDSYDNSDAGGVVLTPSGSSSPTGLSHQRLTCYVGFDPGTQ